MPSPQTFPLIWTSGPVDLPLGPGKQFIRGPSVGDAIRLSYVLQAGAPVVQPSTLALGLVVSRTPGSPPELTLNAVSNPTRFTIFTDPISGLPAFSVDILDTETAALEPGSHYVAPLDLTTGTGHALAKCEIWLDPSPEYTPGIGPALGYRPPNTVLAGPAIGAATSPAFRTLVVADIPGGLPYVPVTGGTNLTLSGNITAGTGIVSLFYDGLGIGAPSIDPFDRILYISIDGNAYPMLDWSCSLANNSAMLIGNGCLIVSPLGLGAFGVTPGVTLAAPLSMGGNKITGASSLGTNTVSFSALPSGSEGMHAWVHDSATGLTFGAIVSAGGGANKVPVYHDGTNWRVG